VQLFFLQRIFYSNSSAIKVYLAEKVMTDSSCDIPLFVHCYTIFLADNDVTERLRESVDFSKVGQP
jgi:hypothetical protein